MITGAVEVLEVHATNSRDRLRTTNISNQDGVVVLDGTAVVWRDPEVAATAAG